MIDTISVLAAIAVLAILGFTIWIKLRPVFGVEQPLPESSADHDAHPLNDADKLQSELESGISSLPDAIILLDDQWRIQWFNQTAAKWMGVRGNSDIGALIWEVTVASGLKAYLLTEQYGESFEFQAPTDPSIYLALRIVPYRSGHFLALGQDISKVRQLEQVRRDFVANASHELRTPLSILYGYLEMMQSESSENISEAWQPAVRQMFEQTSRIKQIIDDMMLLSRIENNDIESDHVFTAIAPLMQTAFEDAKALAINKQHNIETDIDENYSLLCNKEEIQSLVMNLISNAVRYTPDHGKIHIKWKVDLSGGRISVEDSGIGIEKENIPRLTERFYRADAARLRATGGTGLGLAIVNHIVQRHGANLGIESEIGWGSRFSVLFPPQLVRADHQQVNLLLN